MQIEVAGHVLAYGDIASRGALAIKINIAYRHYSIDLGAMATCRNPAADKAGDPGRGALDNGFLQLSLLLGPEGLAYPLNMGTATMFIDLSEDGLKRIFCR